MMKMLRALILGLALPVPTAVAAQPAEAQQLRLRISTNLLRAAKIKEVIVREVTKVDLSDMSARPQWRSMLLDAFTEEWDHDEPAMTAIRPAPSSATSASRSCAPA